MAGNSTQSSNKGDLESTISDDPRKTAIKDFGLLQLLSPRTTAILESTTETVRRFGIGYGTTY
jgi:hypothetical protein